jgi:hypothetical protein
LDLCAGISEFAVVFCGRLGPLEVRCIMAPYETYETNRPMKLNVRFTFSCGPAL